VGENAPARDAQSECANLVSIASKDCLSGAGVVDGENVRMYSNWRTIGSYLTRTWSDNNATEITSCVSNAPLYLKTVVDVKKVSFTKINFPRITFVPREVLPNRATLGCPQTQMHKQTESVLARVGQQLSHLERRDWELWVIVSFTGVLVATGLLAILFPAAFLKHDNVHLEFTVSRPLAVGLITLLALLNTYLVSKRLEIRRLREDLISSTIQQELVRQQSFTDPLTEIYNRRSLEDIAGRFISHARRLKSPLSLLLIDVDRFKDVNTRFGHLTGDVVLADTAALLKSSVRGSDAVFRYGGDEFLIILADTSGTGAAKVIERIRAYLLDWNRAATLEGFELNLSIGVSEWSDDMTLDQLLDEADREMYAAKANHTLRKHRPSLVRAVAQKIGL